MHQFTFCISRKEIINHRCQNRKSRRSTSMALNCLPNTPLPRVSASLSLSLVCEQDRWCSDFFLRSPKSSVVEGVARGTILRAFDVQNRVLRIFYYLMSCRSWFLSALLLSIRTTPCLYLYLCFCFCFYLFLFLFRFCFCFCLDKSRKICLFCFCFCFYLCFCFCCFCFCFCLGKSLSEPHIS